MNLGRKYVTNFPRKNRPTARNNIVSILTKEILANTSEDAFLVGSEYALCRRFKVSRVTVRLALDDLQNLGVVFRKHGVGTFAHGKNSRIQRNLMVLVDVSAISHNQPLAEFLDGIKEYAKEKKMPVLCTDSLPEEWRPELAAILTGVIVLLDDMPTQSTANLRQRRLPHLVIGTSGYALKITELSQGYGSSAPIDRLEGGSMEAGRLAAELMMNAFFRLGPAPAN